MSKPIVLTDPETDFTLNTGTGYGAARRRGSSWWRRLLGQSPRHTRNLDAYRRLGLQLHFDLPRESGARSVLLLTPRRSRLGATAGVGLAFCLGEDLRKPVLLVDACPARPDLSANLETANLPGWSDLLDDPRRDWEGVILPTSSDYVRFLPAGTTSFASPLPEEGRIQLARARERYDFVILFGGSVLDDLTGLDLVPDAGCVLLLVEENETFTSDLTAAEQTLALCKAENVRIVLTSPLPGKSGFLVADRNERIAGGPDSAP